MEKEQKFIFTPDNLIENIDKIGAWSIYGLASIFNPKAPTLNK